MKRAAVAPAIDFGLGLRAPHYRHVLESRPAVSWLEVITENFLRGQPLHLLERLRRDYPVALHGVSLSVGSADPLNLDYLTRLRELSARIQPLWVSDHLCWTGIDGVNLHELLPLPYTREVARHVALKIKRAQDFLGRTLVLENVSSYIAFKGSEMSEWEFVSEVARLSDCEILLDINNIYVASVNHGFDPMDYVDGIDGARIRQLHLAGHSRRGGFLIDTHDGPVARAVWELYGRAIRKWGPKPVLLERDANIPAFGELMAELAQARQIQEDILGKNAKGARGRRPARAPAALAALDHH